MYEAAAFSFIGGISSKVLQSDKGLYNLSDIEGAMNDWTDIHSSKTSLLWMENPTN